MTDLNGLYVTAKLNNREAEAAALAIAIKFAKEAGEWAACLRCSAAFAFASDLRIHSSQVHNR